MLYSEFFFKLKENSSMNVMICIKILDLIFHYFFFDNNQWQSKVLGIFGICTSMNIVKFGQFLPNFDLVLRHHFRKQEKLLRKYNKLKMFVTFNKNTFMSYNVRPKIYFLFQNIISIFDYKWIFWTKNNFF